jgi:hypothetical protein
VRFASNPRSWFFSREFRFALDVGHPAKRRIVRIDPFSLAKTFGKQGCPQISCSLDQINMSWPDSTGISCKIHDFLLFAETKLGIGTKIHYVGQRNHPQPRVGDGNHRGLADTLTHAAEQGDDVFLFSNIFHGHQHSETNGGGIQFIVSNSFVDEVKMEDEPDLIGKLFIYYFDPITQRDDRRSDLDRLSNLLKKIRDDSHIEAVEMHFEAEGSDEYLSMGSHSVPANSKHHFRCCVKNDELAIENLS